MNGEMPSITNLLLLLSLMQSVVFLPAASAVSSSFHGQPTSRLPPSSSQQLHRLRPLRYPSSSSSLAFSIARRTNYVHNAESSKTASIRAASINSHFKQPVRTNFRGSSRRSGIGGSIDDVDYHNMDSSTDDNIPYEILPLTEVIRYLAPPPSSSHDRYNSNMDNAYNIGPDSGNVGNRFDDGNGSRKGDMESPIPSLPLLSDAQAHQRLQQFGPNILPSTRKQLSLWEIWWKQFEEDVLAKILACAALVSVLSSVSDVWNDVNSSIDSAAAGGAVGWGGVGGVVDISSSLVHSLIEPLAIIAILVLNAGVGAWQEVSARRSLEALEAMQPRVATVLRRYDDDNAGNDADDDATITNISDHNDRFNVPSTTNTETTTTATTTTIATTPIKATARWIPNYDATHLVPGDVIRLRAGNAIPADSRLLSLQSSSASLTSYSSYSSLLSSPSSSTSYSSMDVDESSLTGESGSVMKFPGDNIVVPAAGSVMQNDNHTKKSEDEADDDDGTSSIEHELAPGATATITTTMPVPIQDQSSMLFSGCLVTRGSGTALVVRTGPNTQMGKIRSATIEAESEGAGRRTPLGDQLQQFGHVLSYAIGGICIAIWIASIPHFSDPAFASSMEGAVYYAKVGVALGVAAIPEGLPSAITLCLSLGARRMAGRNAIVRRLASVETLGCTSVICTDKTGTLTTNQMTAVSFLLLEDERGGDESVEIVEHEVTGNSYNPSGSVVGISREETINHPLGSISDACDVMTLCNDARLFAKGDDDDDDNAIINIREKSTVDDTVAARFAIEGEPTEAALLCLVEKLGPRGIDEESRQKIPSLSTIASQNYEYFTNRWNRYATLEFDRKRKSMGVLVVERGASDTRMADDSDWSPQCRLLVKGAPGTLLDRCSHAKLRDGSIIPISAEVRGRIESAISSIGGRALRCIALAVKDGDSLDANLLQKNGQYDNILKDSSKYIDIESSLTFVGMVAIKDPPRPGVSESIEECKRAGIRVIMITGDAKATAVAIAKDIHIFHDHKGDDDATMKAFESTDFFAMPNSMQLEILRNDNLVICRAEPTDKRQLVKMLQSLGEIPAMTGDGVNDAPALVQASIGIAMGISGTEVAKEAADMVLVDDNFSTIVNAVEEGRCIYANMQAFINFLITCNIGEVIGVFLASLLGFPQLLSPLHILWLNLATDGPPATALGFNPPDPELMNKKPRPISDELLTPTLLFRYVSAGLYIGVATVGIYASYFLDHGISLEQLSTWSTCADSASCSIYNDLAAPQTLALTTMVTMELLKALCTVSVDSSILNVGPQKNPWLLLGVAVPFAFNLAIIYTPAFQSNFGLVSLSMEDWMHVLMWSSPIVLIDELQKFLSRYQDRRKAAGQLT